MSLRLYQTKEVPAQILVEASEEKKTHHLSTCHFIFYDKFFLHILSVQATIRAFNLDKYNSDSV